MMLSSFLRRTKHWRVEAFTTRKPSRQCQPIASLPALSLTPDKAIDLLAAIVELYLLRPYRTERNALRFRRTETMWPSQDTPICRGFLAANLAPQLTYKQTDLSEIANYGSRAGSCRFLQSSSLWSRAVVARQNDSRLSSPAYTGACNIVTGTSSRAGPCRVLASHNGSVRLSP
jgi:hypothetical protein